MDTLQEIVLASNDRRIGLDLFDVAVDGCITKAPSFAGSSVRVVLNI
jgi:hypothetical protein